MVSFSSEGATVSYVPEFLAKTESALRPLPRSFLVRSLSDFAMGLDENLLLCLVRSLREYVKRTSVFVNHPRCLVIRLKLCQKMLFRISFGKLSLSRVLVEIQVLPLAPIVLEALQPRLPFIGTGQF